MKASSLTISVPPDSSAARFDFSAAGFIATSVLGWSPGVRMSREAKWIWKAETPCGVPAGARISAGKSGRVERSLPTWAVAAVKRPPTSCMPSPESPANRTMTLSCFFPVVATFRRRLSRPIDDGSTPATRLSRTPLEDGYERVGTA